MFGGCRMLKYILYPGEVVSMNDGDTHYVSSKNLIWLYDVDPTECVEMSKLSRDTPRNRELLSTLTPLVPKFDGNYKIPEDYWL